MSVQLNSIPSCRRRNKASLNFLLNNISKSSSSSIKSQVVMEIILSGKQHSIKHTSKNFYSQELSKFLWKIYQLHHYLTLRTIFSWRITMFCPFRAVHKALSVRRSTSCCKLRAGTRHRGQIRWMSFRHILVTVRSSSCLFIGAI